MLTFIAVGLVFGVALSQNKNKIPLIGSEAPSFKANSTEGKIMFPGSMGDSWKILFSHPKDFTPVCTSELLELAYLDERLDRLNVKVAVVSTDNIEQHHLWKAHLEELDYKGRGQQSINFPLIEDEDAKISMKYGMIHYPVSTVRDVRGVFIMDSENIVRSINFYPMEVGRNMDEIVRIVEALQKSDADQVLTPANWSEGDDVLMPHFPYTKSELAEDPALKDKFYNVGNRMYFKKESKKEE